MDSTRWKAIVTMSSDHAGIAAELQRLEDEIRRALSRIDDPRQVRTYITALRQQSANWCLRNSVDMRGWMERFARRGA